MRYVTTMHGRFLHIPHPEFPRTHTVCGLDHLRNSLVPSVKRPEQGYPLCGRCSAR